LLHSKDQLPLPVQPEIKNLNCSPLPFNNNLAFDRQNQDIHNIDTRQMNNLYLPQANLTIYQKGAYYSAIKIFNNLPLEIKIVAHSQKKVKHALKKFLYTYTFYTMEEYLTGS
jgi:hypothetical protein